MTDPLVSILVPCYNAAPWLAQTLESALAQTWRNVEIIVVNDGSTDDSLRLARTFETQGVQVIDQLNRGQCAAANHALRLARGDYVKFFDADDILSPDMIERQIRALASRPGAVACGEWARFHRDPAEAMFTPRRGWHDAAPIDWLVEIWEDAQPMMQCALFLIPRELLTRTGGWDERLSLINDFEFFARVVLASAGVVFTPGARLYYRSGLAGSLSAGKSRSAWQSAFLSLTTGTQHLLAAEDSPRTRRVAAAILQGLIYDMYPSTPTLVADLERRVALLGGSSLPPLGGRGFQLSRRLLGWKAARWLQIYAGKFPPPTRAEPMD
jgi:glycosyltransferase involved in cell wall biosynthesis